jgi:hypothetical protein
MLAVVRLLARVCAGVYGQGAPLDEALAAVWMVTLIWPFVCVYSVMPLQVRLAIEALAMMSVAWPRTRLAEVGRPSRDGRTHLTTSLPGALKSAIHRRFVISNNLRDVHLSRLPKYSFSLVDIPGP